jgi:hypothetical protein
LFSRRETNWLQSSGNTVVSYQIRLVLGRAHLSTLVQAGPRIRVSNISPFMSPRRDDDCGTTESRADNTGGGRAPSGDRRKRAQECMFRGVPGDYEPTKGDSKLKEAREGLSETVRVLSTASDGE